MVPSSCFSARICAIAMMAIMVLVVVLPGLGRNSAAAPSVVLKTNQQRYTYVRLGDYSEVPETVKVTASWSGVYAKAGCGDPNVYLLKDGAVWEPYYYADINGGSGSISRTISGVSPGVHKVTIWYATGWDRNVYGYKMSSVEVTYVMVRFTYYVEFENNVIEYKQGASAAISIADSNYFAGSAVKFALHVGFSDSSYIELGYMEGWYVDGTGKLIELKTPTFYMEYNVYDGTLGAPYKHNWAQFGAAAIGTSHTIVVRLQSLTVSNGCHLWGVMIDGAYKYTSIPITTLTVPDGNAMFYDIIAYCYSWSDKTTTKTYFENLKELQYGAVENWYGWVGLDAIEGYPPWAPVPWQYNYGVQPDWFACWLGTVPGYWGVATYPYPFDGQTGVSLTSTLTWNGPADANCYYVEIWTGDYASPTWGPVGTGTTAPSWRVTLSPSVTWSWHVKCSPDGGTTWGHLSSTWSFTTVSGGYQGVATLLSPANGATGVPLTTSLTWRGPPGANYYHVEIGPLGTYTSASSWTVTLSAGVTWSWHVDSSPDGGATWGPWSATWTFKTKTSSGGCVLEGTMITVADGTSVPVEKLAKGTPIMSLDLSTGGLISETVISDKMTVVSGVEILNDGLLALTPVDQPIYVRHDSFTGWIRDPQDLQIGWEVFCPHDGSWTTITRISFDEGKFKVYDVVATGPNNFIGNGILLDSKQP